MFGSIKKALVAGAIVAVGVVAAPVAANASGTWTTGGSVFSGTMAGQAHGSLTLVPAGTNPLRVTCDVTLDVSLSNGPSPTPNGHLLVTAAAFDNCVTNIPGCTVTATALGTGSTLPWTGTGDAATQAINVGGVFFKNTFGAGCPAPLTGGTFSEAGTLSPVLDSSLQTISFDGTAATGTLTGPLGTAYVDGDLTVTTPAALGLI